MTVTVGRIVHYRLSEQDAAIIEQSRIAADGPGNPVEPGSVYPAMVVRVWGHETANLQVFLDGPDTYWKTSAQPGDDDGDWFWPPRVDMTREGR